MFIVHVGRDEEVLELITDRSRRGNVVDAALTLIGAVHQCTVSVMPKGNTLEDIATDYDQRFELTGTGEIVDCKVHVHVTIGGDGVVVAGHLHRATVRD